MDRRSAGRPLKRAADPATDQDQADTLQIESFVRGEMTGFKFIYARHRQRVFSYCLYYMSDRVLAEDAFQEVFTRVFTHREQLREPKALKSWLTLITRSVCLNMLRTSKFTPEFVPVTSSGAALSANDDGDGLEFKELTIDPREAMQTDDLLKLALSKLSPIYRDAFLLREFEGYSYEEIAKVANTTVMNVKVRITRAKKRLRELLQPYFRNMGQRSRTAFVENISEERESLESERIENGSKESVPQHHAEGHEDEEVFYAR